MCHAILLISCFDNKGITATVASFISTNSGNIVHADQHIDEESNTFFMRIEWSLKGFSIPQEKIAEAFLPIAQKFQMKWEIFFTEDAPRLAIFVSQRLHCLYDLLFRYRAGQLPCRISLIISNHPEASGIAGEFGVRFLEFPITEENKRDQERKEIDILKEENIDLVVLARYHQILTSQFIQAFPNKIINIHHSFLPAFAGQNPYLQAYR
ncbi:MAG: formyltetrahydrofolate deformylase, partial [Candidatus Omnitrophota bacterium]